MCTPRKTKLLLVEDHVVLREGLRALLELEPDLDVVGAVGDAAAGLQAVRALRPEVLLTDIALPGRSGIDLIRHLASIGRELRVLVLTGHAGEEYLRAAFNAGALGFVLKDSSRTELLSGVRAVAAGRQFLCSAVATRVVSGFVHGVQQKNLSLPEDVVTTRERQILIRIALGHSNKIMARELGLSVKTIEKHRANVMRKLTLHNAADVTLFALRRGLIDASVIPPGAIPSEPPQR